MCSHPVRTHPYTVYTLCTNTQLNLNHVYPVYIPHVLTRTLTLTLAQTLTLTQSNLNDVARWLLLIWRVCPNPNPNPNLTLTQTQTLTLRLLLIWQVRPNPNPNLTLTLRLLLI